MLNTSLDLYFKDFGEILPSHRRCYTAVFTRCRVYNGDDYICSTELNMQILGQTWHFLLNKLVSPVHNLKPLHNWTNHHTGNTPPRTVETSVILSSECRNLISGLG